MFECKACGGNLKFDVGTQQMKCEFCDCTYDPYEVSESHEAKETEMEVTVFICPQCGGEIYSADNSAAEFCSFCGASTILNTRIQKEKRPVKIIPFQKTEEDCKNLYKSFTKKCLYAPKEIRKMKGTNEFRGIYMPYWSYSVSHTGNIDVVGSRSYRDGDYLVDESYSLKGNIDAHYNDIPFDAASDFADDISERVAPYKTTEYKDFTPAYLSGFYADIADVDKKTYEAKARSLARENTYRCLDKEKEFAGIYINNTRLTDEALNAKTEAEEAVMMPVWFMSYRSGDRVSYATVNGQTGKVAADVPISLKKFFIGVIPIYIIVLIIINALLSFSANGLLWVSGILSLLIIVIFTYNNSSIEERESGSGDEGKKNILGSIKGHMQDIRDGNVNENEELFLKKSPKKKEEAKAHKDKEDKKEPDKNLNPIMPPFFCVILCLIIGFISPHEDLWYYGTVIITLGCALYTTLRLIARFNMLTTRKLPQLEERGGERHEA